MRPLLRVRAQGRQLTRLQSTYQCTRCPRTRLRIQMVLLSHQGYSIEEIARITRHSDETVRRWLHRFLEEGCAGLNESPYSGRPPAITSAIEHFLLECIPSSPRDFGINRPCWTTTILARLVKQRFKVEVSDECIRQHLEKFGVVCRRPTWTVKHLAQQKPGYAQKKGL